MVSLRNAVQLYHFTHPDELVDSRYGLIKWSKFLELEKARISKNPERNAEIIKGENGKSGMISLLVNQVTVEQSHCKRYHRAVR